MTRPTVAVIGGGAAGIMAAHELQKSCEVTLYEAGRQLGGHVDTHIVQSGPEAGTPVDLGFIVLNDRTYPTLHGLFSQLKVSVRSADMSFGYHDHVSGLQYAGTTLRGLFAQPRNALNGSYWRMLLDIARFGRKGRADLKSGGAQRQTLGAYVESGGYGELFAQHYLYPMGSAIWSTAPEEMLEFPASTFLRFFDNHGLLDLSDRPQWQTVIGGSQAYVRAFRKSFRGIVREATPVQSVRRSVEKVTIQASCGPMHYDKVVMACHADDALKLLEDPTPQERRLLGAWRYSNNQAILHTDVSVLPPKTAAWASWNYARESGQSGPHPQAATLTYDMTRLQGLSAGNRYLVSINGRRPRQELILAERLYRHPLYTFDAVASQNELAGLNGQGRTYFCGSYFGYGFHEDAVRSGLCAAKAVDFDMSRRESYEHHHG